MLEWPYIFINKIKNLQDSTALGLIWGTSSQSPCHGDSAVLGIPAPWRAFTCTNTCSSHSPARFSSFPQLSATSYPTFLFIKHQSQQDPLHLCLSLFWVWPKTPALASVSSLSFLALIVTWKAQIVSSCPQYLWSVGPFKNLEKGTGGGRTSVPSTSHQGTETMDLPRWAVLSSRG